MTATIYDLRRATGSSATHFRRLAAAVCEERILRTSYFAETRIRLDGRPYTLFMPLSGNAMVRVERFAPLRRNLVSPVVPQMEILCDEMKYEDTLGREFTSDILIEALPQGLPLTDAIDAIDDDADAARLVGAVDALERELRRARVSHNNLRADNILIDADGALYPVRWIYATDGAGGDRKSLDDLRTMIAQRGDAAAAEHAAFDPYGPAVEGTYGIGTLSEGLAPVETPRGWGFADSTRRIVIEAQYLWVRGFREGRAEVQTLSGMGLIDKQGRYVIEPIFDIVDYDPETGNSQVRRGEEWAVFDYSGRQTAAFADKQPAL